MSRQGDYRKPTIENILAFWEAEAQEIGSTPQVTIRDHYFRLHELYCLLPLIPKCNRLMDIGCGTGFGTLVLARRSQYTLGIDYSSKMIKWAERLKQDIKYREQLSKEFCILSGFVQPEAPDSLVEFMLGDVLNLNLDKQPFDVITGQRILINLPSHNDQMKALEKLRNNSSAEGWLILTEATLQGHQRTDSYRALFNLPLLEKYWHNNYVDEDRFNDWLKVGWKIEYNLAFETYTLLSKVVYPAAYGYEKCEFLSEANAAAMEMACFFRSKSAVDEIGIANFFQMYIEKIKRYNELQAIPILTWLDQNGAILPDWSQLGHQRLIVARAC